MKLPRTVLFDLDGTLADTAPDLGLALNMLRQRHGLAPLALETIRPYASHGSRGLLGIGFGVQPEEECFAALRDEYLALYDAVFARSPRLFPGMSELLGVLEQSGLRWGVVTNKPRRFTQPLMQALGLHERAACIVSGDDARRPKPAPDGLLLACVQTESAPAACWYVGDAARDIEAGRAVGMPTVVARYGYLSADDQPETWGATYHIRHPAELALLLNLKALSR